MQVFRWLLIMAAAWVTTWAAAQGGPAVIADTADGGGPGGGTFFVVTEIDGQPVPTNALEVSMRASAGRGAYMTVHPYERGLQPGRTRLKLLGKQAHAAPIQSIFKSIFSSGGVPEVSGEVTVDLQPGMRYRVNGLLDSYRREVWLEEHTSGKVIGDRIAVPVDPALLKQMEGAAFITTNLRYDGDWIGDAPTPNLPFVPAGSRLKVLDWGSNRANVLIDGRKMRIGVDYARKEQTIGAMVARLTSEQDPRPRIAEWPEQVRNAVRAGRVVPGMTREQVEVALGRPRMDLLPSTTMDEWPYHFEAEEIFVIFGSDGRLKEVDASRKGRALVLMANSAPAAVPPSPPAPSPTSPSAPTAAGASAPAAASAPR